MPTYSAHKPKIETDLLITRNGYGFGYDWQLKVQVRNKIKVFYLGQDAKVCRRILGLRPDDLINEIGSNDLNLLSTRTAIANLILDAIGVNDDNLNEFLNLQPWEIAAE